MPCMVYSYSRLSLYMTCPFRFYLRYIEKWEEPITAPLALGKAVHKAIESFLKGRDKETALMDGIVEADFYPFDKAEYKELVGKAPCIQGEGLSQNVTIEQYFKLRLSDDPSSPYLQGYIDLVRENFGMYSFVDWKTNRKKYDSTANMQLPLYAWALATIHKLDSVQGTLFFLRYFKNAAVSKVFTVDEMDEARKWALSLAEEIEQKLFLLEVGAGKAGDIFPATPSSHCRYCPFAYDCLKIHTSLGVS
ncbi:MAG TPA: PD-(D/E)XK nuclease family protein [Bacillus sp. (in: firmicutes)]|nr:PD-(D/E)XK nuclease family protein [Bacillus sp. (in: firmicutes)]